jgi:hypothetical protein
MIYPMIVLGLVCFLAPWLARLAGYEGGRKPFDFVGIGGIFFLLSGALSIGITLMTTMIETCRLFIIGTFGLGTVMLLVGAVWELVDILRAPTHSLAVKL